MSHWEVIGEEASIALIGNFNPMIFHPEWFIRKGIIDENWNYSEDEVSPINMPDMSSMRLPKERYLTVYLNKFVIRSSLASEYLPLSDIVSNTFSHLNETPISQLGMNLTSIIKISDETKWRKFSLSLAPHKHWKKIASYIAKLDKHKQKELGLLVLNMQLPRADDHIGHIRPQIEVFPQAGPYTLKININNHIEIKDKNASEIPSILNTEWRKSISLANEITKNIMNSQLGAV